jgi:hypothetical protein
MITAVLPIAHHLNLARRTMEFNFRLESVFNPADSHLDRLKPVPFQLADRAMLAQNATP